MATVEKGVRQSVTLPARVARRVKSLAKTNGTSANRIIVELIESGIEARQQDLWRVMPRIQWSGLPPALRDHLFERLRERKITAEDLYQLKLWRESSPDAPDGAWYKDFGSFKICGEGRFPKTFLLAGQAAKGQKL